MAGFFTAPGNEGNAYRREVIANLAGDAMRQMNPFRDSSTPPVNQQPVQNRPATLNIPGDNGQPATAATQTAQKVTPQPATSPAASSLIGGQGQAATATPGKVATSLSNNENVQPNSMAATALASNPQQPQPFKSTIQSGVAGQDGYGLAKRTGALPQPGSTMRNLGLPDQPNALPVNVRSLAGLGNTMGTTRGDGFEFTGSAADAAKFFRKPLGGPAVSASPAARALAGPPPVQSYSDWADGAAARYDQRVGGGQAASTQQPSTIRPSVKSLIGDLNGLGLDWRTKQAIALQQLGSGSAADLESMREAGLDRRTALAQASSQEQFREQNDVARGNLALNQLATGARLGTEQINQQKGQMELDQAKKIQALNDQYMAEKDPAKQRALGNQLLTMQGKSTKDWQITTREEPLDPANPMLGTTKRPYAVNLNDPNQIIELGGGAGGAAPSTTAPQTAIDYLKKNPGQAQFFKQKYGYLPEGF